MDIGHRDLIVSRLIILCRILVYVTALSFLRVIIFIEYSIEPNALFRKYTCGFFV